MRTTHIERTYRLRIFGMSTRQHEASLNVKNPVKSVSFHRYSLQCIQDLGADCGTYNRVKS